MLPEAFDGINFDADPRYGANFLRGRDNVFSFFAARELSRSWRAPDDFGVFWGGLYLRSEDATNFAVLGVPGSGKTTLIRLLMQSVLPLIGLREKSRARAQLVDPNFYALRFGSSHPEKHPPKVEDHRALIFDVKEEYLPLLAGMNLNCPVKVLNPFSSEAALWETGKDVQEEQVKTFAKIFIPDQNNSSEKNPFFTNAARDVVSMVVTALNRQRPLKWTFLDFAQTMGSRHNYIRLIQSYADLAEQFEEVQARRETFDNVVQQIRTHVTEILPAATAWQRSHQRFSLRDWLGEESILVLSRKEQNRDSVDPIYRLIFGVAAGMALSLGEATHRRTWFFLDELGNAGELTKLTELMSMGRSKGCSVVLGAQGLPTLRRAFGNKDTVDEILEMCPYIAILRAGGEETAKWAEGLLGKCEFYESKKGHSLSQAYTSGQSRGTTQATTDTVSRAHAIGKSTAKGVSSSASSSFMRGDSVGTSDSSGGTQNDMMQRSINWNTGSTSSTSSSNTFGETSGTNTSTTDSITDTDTLSRAESRGTSENESQSTTDTAGDSINRERVERSLVQASQIMSLKTLKYDGLLLGYYISPFGTYAAALPGTYLKRALQVSKPSSALDAPRGKSLTSGDPLKSTKAPKDKEAGVIAVRLRQSTVQRPRPIDPK